MLTVRRRPLILYLLRQFFYACTRPLQKGYWFLFRPYRPGAKTFVFYQDKLLLVRIGYAHKKWCLPGGGIERGETSEKAAIREAYEEAGVRVVSPLYIGERSYDNQYKKVVVFYYTGIILTDDLVIDGQEIVDAQWFLLNALPVTISPRLRDEITMYTNWKYGKK